MMARALLLGLLLLLAGVGAVALSVTQRGNQLLLDGTPTALTFARGCEDPATVPAYRDLGFNTLLVRVDSPSPARLQRVDALLDAAEQAGLYVLIELCNGSWSVGQRADLADTTYQENVAYFLSEVLPRYRDRPTLLGWIVSTVDEGKLVCGVSTFGQFLLDKYGSLTGINTAWTFTTVDKTVYRARLTTLSDVTDRNALRFDANRPEVRKLIQADIDAYHAALAARDGAFQRYLQARYTSLDDLNARWDFQFAEWKAVSVDTVLRREAQLPGSSPTSTLEYAGFQANLPRLLFTWWVGQLKTYDTRHLVFAGAQRSYRTLAGLPPSLNGAFTECYPGVTEPDLENANPQAIDIARRGNRFIVLAGVPADNTDPTRFMNYLYEAALHGAAGVGVNGWSTLAASPAHARAAQTALADLRTRALLGRTPRPRTAFVYSPYPLGTPAVGRPLYGYQSGFPYYGPANVFFSLRTGTCYGQFDYLAAEDLPVLPLDRYRTLILPSVVDFPEDSQRALVTFVDHGGIALADLALGTLQANGNYHMLPPLMQQLFGILCVPGLKPVRYNLEVYRQDGRFPLLLQGMRSTGLQDGYAVMKAAKAVPVGGTDLLFSMTSARTLQLPQPRPYRPLEQKATYGVFLARRGNGLALYAPTFLYQAWIPGSRLFDEFHRGLFGDQARVELERPFDFIPTFGEVTTYADGSVAAWTRDHTLPLVRLTNPERRAYATLAGSCLFTPEATKLLFTKPGFHITEPLPVFLDPAPFAVRVTAVQVNPAGMVFDLAADGDAATKSLTLRIISGTYPITPGSKHQASVLTAAGVRDLDVVADARGMLTLAIPTRCRLFLSGATAFLKVEPLPPPSDEILIVPIPIMPDNDTVNEPDEE